LIPGVTSIAVPKNTPVPFNDFLGMARIDWKQSVRSQWFLRASSDSYLTRNDLIQQGTLPSTGATSHSNYLNLAVGEQYAFSPTWVGTFLFGASGLHRTEERNDYVGFSLQFPFSASFRTVSGLDTFGDNQFATAVTAFPVLRNQEKYQLRYDVSHSAGRHAPSFGINFIHEPVLSGALSGTAETVLTYPQDPTSYAVNPAEFFFSAGCTAQPDQATGISCTAVPASNGSFSQNVQRLGFYAQDSWRVTRHLTVNYGLRYDQVATVVDESQWSPRVGLVYQLGSDTRVHAGYARYFTPPPTEKIDTTSVQKFLGTTNALPSDANTAVRSERSHYFDLGVSHELIPGLTLGADAYYRKVQHLQDEGQFGNALIYSAFNYEQGRIYGLELSASYKEKQLSAYANVSFTAARGQGIETGQFNFDADELAYIQSHWVHLDHEQKFAASTGVSYRFGDSTVLGTDVLYGSGLRNGFANTGHLPSYVQVNASASRSFDTSALGKFDLRLSAINLFDRSYELRDGSGIGVGAPQFAPRRTLYLSLSKPFTF